MSLSSPIENLIPSPRKRFIAGTAIYFAADWLISSYILEFDFFSHHIIFIESVLSSFFGFLLACLLGYIFKKFTIYKVRLHYMLLMAALLSSIVGILWLFGSILISALVRNQPVVDIFYKFKLFTWYNFSIYFLWSCLYLGYKIWEEWNKHIIQLEIEKALLRASQLEMLRYQINPHFLFNSLSTLRGLISVEPEKARNVVTEISGFLQYALIEGKNNEVPLIKEIENTKLYLNIEKTRHDENLIFNLNIEKETHNCIIPIFLLQPLVENAIKHGMQTTKLPLIIDINARMINKCLLLEVKNSGCWNESKAGSGIVSTSIGLKNIRKRLEHQFPNRHSFEIVKEPESVKISIQIDFSK